MRGRVLVGLAVLAAAGVVAWLVVHSPSPDEPVYQGHALSYWLNSLPSREPVENSAAAAAISQIGTNAIPSLLRIVNGKNPSVSPGVIYALGRIHADPQEVVPVLTRELFDSNFATRSYAVEGLANFGTNARPAAPLLATMLNDPRLYQGAPPQNSPASGDLREKIKSALQQIEPDTSSRVATNSDNAAPGTGNH